MACLRCRPIRNHEDALKRVGIDTARGLIAAVGTDAENVYTRAECARAAARPVHHRSRRRRDATRKLLRAGANRVVSPYQIGAVQMAQTAIRPAVVDFHDPRDQLGNLELAMEEITVERRSSLVQKSLLDANLRQRFGVIVVAIQREDRHMEFNPEPDTAILAGDKLVVLRPHSLRRLEEELRPDVSSIVRWCRDCPGDSRRSSSRRPMRSRVTGRQPGSHWCWWKRSGVRLYVGKLSRLAGERHSC